MALGNGTNPRVSVRISVARNLENTSVSDTKKSSANLARTCHLPSEQDAVHRLMVTELLSSNSAETTVTVLLLILEGFVKETLSPDSMKLAIYRAVDRMKAMGLDQNEEAKDVVQKFATWAEAHRRQNPFAGMF